MKRAGRVAGRAPRGPRTAVPAAGVIGQLQAYRNELVAQRTQVDSQLAAVDGALSALGSAARVTPVAGRRGTPAGRAGSLKEFIARVLRARPGPMSVKEITAAVRTAGYKSKNRTLDKSVGITLAGMTQVTKVARGQYRIRG